MDLLVMTLHDCNYFMTAYKELIAKYCHCHTVGSNVMIRL